VFAANEKRDGAFVILIFFLLIRKSRRVLKSGLQTEDLIAEAMMDVTRSVRVGDDHFNLMPRHCLPSHWVHMHELDVLVILT
jgi:hypothetical protein